MENLTPIFPLQIVVFPGDTLNLHIFEPRYKELINECYKESKIFGIPTYFKDTKLTYGTTIRIDGIENRYKDGKLDIRTTGLKVFYIRRLIKNVPGKLYSKAEVVYINQKQNGLEKLNQSILNYVRDLYRIMSMEKSLAQTDDPQFCFKISHHIGMSLPQKFELIKIDDEYSRQLYLIEYLKELVPTLKKMEGIKKKARMNGHFKNLKPPEF